MITILAGAGASYAINKDKFPTTVVYLNRLPDDIKNNELFKIFETSLLKKDPNAKLDIEQFLWEMSLVSASMTRMLNADDSLGSSYKFAVKGLTHRVQSLLNARQNLGISPNEPFDSLRRYLDQLNKLIERINQNVFELYSDEPTQDELSENWYPFFDNLLNENENIALFTLNYDLIPETIADYLRRREISFEDGRKFGARASFDASFWSEKKYESDNSIRVTITKLHGSIDWRRRKDGGINIGNTDFSGQLDDHLLLYPGYDKASHNEPFASFHNYFQHCLFQSNQIIVVGYAFRDKSVNSIIERALNADMHRRLSVIDVHGNLPVSFERQDQCTIFTGEGQGFSKLTIEEVMANIAGKCGPRDKG